MFYLSLCSISLRVLPTFAFYLSSCSTYLCVLPLLCSTSFCVLSLFVFYLPSCSIFLNALPIFVFYLSSCSTYLRVLPIFLFYLSSRSAYLRVLPLFVFYLSWTAISFSNTLEQRAVFRETTWRETRKTLKKDRANQRYSTWCHVEDNFLSWMRLVFGYVWQRDDPFVTIIKWR